MCGRFAVGEPDPQAWADWLGTAEAGPWPEPSWNVAPTQSAAIVRAGGDGDARRQDIARWGLVPQWWSKPVAEMKASTFNARSEEAAAKPMFRDAWKGSGRAGRCLVPALGYYEWSGRKGARTPWFVTLETNAPGIVLAGLWAVANPEGEPFLSFTILTCAAGEATAHLHPRTPVILAEQDWDGWLSGTAGEALMGPPPDDRVRVRQVGQAVGNVRNDGPGLIEPAGLGL